MKKMLIYAAILFPHLLFSLSIKEKVGKAPKGTYTAYEQNGVTSLLLIKEKLPSHIILEEITVPSKKAPKKGTIKAWIQNGAPCHTAWVSFMLNTTTGQVEEMYSYTQEKWYSPLNANMLFGTLLSLNFQEVSKERQRKIGPPPQDNSIDRRKIWKPVLIREGKTIKERAYDVYSAVWPKDGTELSEKTIEIYLDRNSQEFPFPYWIEIKDTAITFKLRALDSGDGVISPYSKTPMRPISLIHPIQKRNSGLTITLLAQSYHFPCKITLFNTQQGNTYLLDDAHITKKADGIVEIHIPKTLLDEKGCVPGLYQLTFAPEGKAPSLSCVTPSFRM